MAKEVRQKTLYGEITKIDDDEMIVGGSFTDEKMDLMGDLIDKEATEEAVDEWRAWSNIREQHGMPVGVAIKVGEPKWNYLEAKIVDEDCWEKIKAGVYKGFSVGIAVLDFIVYSLEQARKEMEDRLDDTVIERLRLDEVWRITKYMLVEVSVVDRPANPRAVVSMVKRVDSEKKVTPYANLPIHSDEDRAWSGADARKRLWDWADENYTKYRKGFFWYDASDPKKKGSYKLPFADIIDGGPKAIWKGVSAAMGALLGARGGVNVPDGEKKGVYNHIAKYYKKFGKDVPDYKIVRDAIEEYGDIMKALEVVELDIQKDEVDRPGDGKEIARETVYNNTSGSTEPGGREMGKRAKETTSEKETLEVSQEEEVVEEVVEEEVIEEVIEEAEKELTSDEKLLASVDVLNSLLYELVKTMDAFIEKFSKTDEESVETSEEEEVVEEETEDKVAGEDIMEALKGISDILEKMATKPVARKAAVVPDDEEDEEEDEDYDPLHTKRSKQEVEKDFSTQLFRMFNKK